MGYKDSLQTTRRWRFAGCALPFFLLGGLASGAPTSPPSTILDAYRAQRTTWFANVWPATHTLFGLLAIIDFSWSAAVMVLERQDFQSWAAALVRKMMTIGVFYALLIYGRQWIPAITDSFETLGQHASGGGPLSPSDVFVRGLNMAGALIDGATSTGIFKDFGGALALVVAACLTLLAFCGITIQFVVALGKGAAKLQSARNALQNLHRQIPSDAAPHASAPRMNIEHHE